MKKGWKIFWVICISFAVLGMVLCISGAAMGATLGGVRNVLASAGLYHDDREEPDDWDEPDAWDEPDDIDGLTDKENAEEGSSGSEGSSSSEGSSEVMKFSGIRELEIDVVCPKVVIQEYEGSEIQVKTNGIPEEIEKDMTVHSDNEELKIELKNKKKWMNKFGNLNGTLTVEIPAGYVLKEASLEVDAGDLKVENICADELDIQIGAGRAIVKQFTAEELNLECGAGEAEIAGDARRKIQIECGVGEVSYEASGRQQDYNYELNCGIGELQVGKDYFSGLNSKRKIHNGGQVDMEIECGIGSVEVTFHEEK